MMLSQMLLHLLAQLLRQTLLHLLVLLLRQMLLQVQNGLNLLALLLGQMLLHLQGWANLLALQLHRLQRRNLFIMVSILYSYSVKRRCGSLGNTKDPRVVL